MADNESRQDRTNGMMKKARRLAVLVLGTTVLLIGIAMVVLPGPAIVVIPVGLAILGTEYAWARRLLRRFRVASRKGAKHLKLRSLWPGRQSR